MYVSLAPSMEHPAGVDPPMDNAARCFQHTSSDEDDNRSAPITDDRVAGKRPMAQEPSRARAAPGESAQGPSTGHGSASGAQALSTKASQQSTLGYTHGSSLSVDGAQATNLMVMQDTDKVFIQVRPPCGRNTYVLRLIVLDCIERIICLRGVPCPSLYSPESKVTDLETNPSRLQLP